MDGYGKLIVGCVIFIPVIAVLLIASWKMWHGKWLGFSDFSYNSYEGPASLPQRRRGRRTALVCLVGAAAAVGVLGIAAFSAASGFHANLELVLGTMVTLALVSSTWPFAASQRENRACTSDVSGNNLELANEYELTAHRIKILIVVLLAVLAVEIGVSLIA